MSAQVSFSGQCQHAASVARPVLGGGYDFGFDPEIEIDSGFGSLCFRRPYLSQSNHLQPVLIDLLPHAFDIT
jgi:hypothetical protein